ncbi:MAG: ATP-binding protein [Candidatus Sulfotelmatobacter sp.]
MAINLFKDDFTALSGADLYSEIKTFLRLSDTEGSRPQESERLDYKSMWNDSGLKTVAAFANTFGGLLFIGVEEKDMIPVAMPGVTSSGEEKTRIASSIASIISPTPSFDIAECALPREANKHVCLVRVRPSPALYLFTKGENPIYVRNATESRPANAAQLRYLIERAHEPVGTNARINSTLELLRRELIIFTTKGADAAHPERRKASDLFFDLKLFPLNPTEAIDIPLDISLERVLQTSILTRFKRVNSTLRGDVANSEESRGPNYFSYRWHHRSLDYEMVWVFGSDGGLGFASQVSCTLPMGISGSSWSICDVAENLLRMLDLAKEFWTSNGYWGDARVIASLNVGNLPVAMKIPELGGPEKQEAHCFMCGTRNVLDLGSVFLASSPRPCANASADFSVSSIDSDKAEVVASMLNQILRFMGHSASLPDLKDGVVRLLDALREGTD